MHPRQIRPFVSPGRQHTRPDPVPAPAAKAAKDTVPVTEAGLKVPPGKTRAHQVHDSMQEAAGGVGMASVDPGVLAQVAVQGLEFDVAQRVAVQGRGSVKRETNRTAMIICRS